MSHEFNIAAKTLEDAARKFADQGKSGLIYIASASSLYNAAREFAEISPKAPACPDKPEPCKPKFWVVWCPRSGNPRFRHETFGQAKAEAERLASLNPGKRFHVLASTAAFEGQVCVSEADPMSDAKFDTPPDMPF